MSCYSEGVLRFVVLGAVSVVSAIAQPAPLLDILKQEMDRNFSLLKEKSDPAPYFLSYSVSEQQSEYFAGTLGTLQSKSSAAGRILDVSVRVGTPKLDNYHATRGERPQFSVPSLLPMMTSPMQSAGAYGWKRTVPHGPRRSA